MIESAKFTNVDGTVCVFNDDEVPFKEFSTDIDMRTDEEERSLDHGSWPSETYMGMRLWHVTGDILEDEYADYILKRMQMLQAVLPNPRLKKKYAGTLEIHFTGMEEAISSRCTLDGYPDLPIVAMQGARGDYQINWKAFDPYCYGTTIRTASIGPGGAAPTGRTYNKTYPKTYSGTGAIGESAIITNAGNRETKIIATITGPAINPRISIDYGGGDIETMAFNWTLSSTDTVVLNFKDHTAQLNGADAYTLTQGKWWVLPVGSYAVYFQGDTLSVGSHADLEWSYAYMI